MIKGSEKRQAARPIHPIFIDRWSARAMSGERVSPAELMPLFEAARWAPSDNNQQPWRFLYAYRDTPHWDTYLDLIVVGNRTWCAQAGALLLIVSHTFNTVLNARSISNSFDSGAAWENLALQGCHSGLVIRGIGGFDREKARTQLQVPELYDIEMMVAVGKPGVVTDLPEKLRARETPSDRRPLNETVCEGVFAL